MWPFSQKKRCMFIDPDKLFGNPYISHDDAFLNAKNPETKHFEQRILDNHYFAEEAQRDEHLRIAAYVVVKYGNEILIREIEERSKTEFGFSADIIELSERKREKILSSMPEEQSKRVFKGTIVEYHAASAVERNIKDKLDLKVVGYALSITDRTFAIVYRGELDETKGRIVIPGYGYITPEIVKGEEWSTQGLNEVIRQRITLKLI
ncbi:MAG: hypothetical protein ACOC32_02095 [Nanoarchaeota archaeon]